MIPIDSLAPTHASARSVRQSLGARVLAALLLFSAQVATAQIENDLQGFAFERTDSGVSTEAVRPKLSKESGAERVPILFLHGLCSSAATWSSIVGLLRETGSDAERYDGELVELIYDGTRVRPRSGGNTIPESNLYALSLTAHGSAPDPFDPIAVANTSIHEHAFTLARTVQALVDLPGVDQVDLVTHSMGGIVARTYLQDLAHTPAQFPVTYDGASVRKLASIDSPHDGTAFTAWLDLDIALVNEPCLGLDTLNKREMSPLSTDYMLDDLNGRTFPDSVEFLALGARRSHVFDLPGPVPAIPPVSDGDGIVPMDSQIVTRIPGYGLCDAGTGNPGNIRVAPLTFPSSVNLTDPGLLHLQVLGNYLGRDRGERVAQEIDVFLNRTPELPSCLDLFADLPTVIEVPGLDEPGSTTITLDFEETPGSEALDPNAFANTSPCTAEARLLNAAGGVLSSVMTEATGTRSLDLGLLPAGPFDIELEANCTTRVGLSVSKDLSAADVSEGLCAPDPRTLCLQGGRFKVQAVWRTRQGTNGLGFAKSLTPDTGYFWFFDEDNVEVVAKVLDARALNGAFWVFYGALSNTEYYLRVSDTTTGVTRVYYNPFDEFASRGDTSAFVSGTSTADRVQQDRVESDPIEQVLLDATERDVATHWLSPTSGGGSTLRGSLTEEPSSVEIRDSPKRGTVESSEPFAIATDDGTMEIGLTYDTDVFGPDFEGVFAKRFDFTGATGVLGKVSACWTRDSTLGNVDLDYSVRIYAPDDKDDGPGAELASVAATATEVPVSSNGGREGDNCRFYDVDFTDQDIALDRVLYIGASYRPFPYPTPSGFAGYLLGVDSDPLLEPGWFLEPDGWTAMHDSFFFRNLGYRRMMLRAASALEARYQIVGTPKVGEFFTLDASPSTGNPDTYSWLIDGLPVNGQAVTVKFDQPGNVPIQLTVSRGEDSDTLTDTLELTQTGNCLPSSTTLCLADGRFAVEVDWTDFQGGKGTGRPVQVTRDTGYFWFFDPSNIELILKILDARAINDAFWIYFGALSNVEYEITVRDTLTGAAKLYRNPAGNFASVGDTEGLPGG